MSRGSKYGTEGWKSTLPTPGSPKSSTLLCGFSIFSRAKKIKLNKKIGPGVTCQLGWRTPAASLSVVEVCVVCSWCGKLSSQGSGRLGFDLALPAHGTVLGIQTLCSPKTTASSQALITNHLCSAYQAPQDVAWMWRMQLSAAGRLSARHSKRW